MSEKDDKGHVLEEYQPGSGIYLCVNCRKAEKELETICTKQYPSLTGKQIEDGFHIWTEYDYQDKPLYQDDEGNIQRPPMVKGFEHWKKCPCNRDMRLK